ncbi:hypothetical protein OPV22_028555 [Ensete ventricosum]|uniref:Uncharacterized protein n=1 Tax=Ensete ventricosum TaxID=4639 RepID=A0AAV8Q6Q9_ENSVE|nr:hypothetical protein OPV22_028555 [Ensete ventricosum]RWW02522.1 hypothetical protein GW17_00034388 [Ensete ventricosum]
MISGFRRSLSLSGLSPNASPAPRRPRDVPRHARSASLPCRSQPALSLVQDEIRSLRSGTASDLERIDRLLAALDDLLRLSRIQDPLRRRPALADRLLDGFLRLLDAQGSFRSAVLALGQHHAEACTAVRRRDRVRLASAARSLRRAEKELVLLASAIKDLTRCPPFTPGLWADAAEAEVAGIVTEAVAATATAMSAVYLGIAAVSSAAASAAAAASTSKDSWMVWALRRPSPSKKCEAEEAEMGAMEKLEERMEGLEKGSERVYRSLVNIRVALLNALAPSL